MARPGRKGKSAMDSHILNLPDGQGRCLYTEIVDLSRLGELQIRRGSFLEPDQSGRWWAELSPVDGPKLGPFTRRGQALEAEVAWLESHWLERR